MPEDRVAGLLPLTPPVLGILLALADRPRHGYAVMQEVSKRTQGRMQLLPGSLYSTIKRMLSAGLLQECEPSDDDQPQDSRRRYYRVTPLGRRVAQGELKRMQALLEMGREKKLVLEP